MVHLHLDHSMHACLHPQSYIVCSVLVHTSPVGSAGTCNLDAVRCSPVRAPAQDVRSPAGYGINHRRGVEGGRGGDFRSTRTFACIRLYPHQLRGADVRSASSRA